MYVFIMNKNYMTLSTVNWTGKKGKQIKTVFSNVYKQNLIRWFNLIFIKISVSKLEARAIFSSIVITIFVNPNERNKST